MMYINRAQAKKVTGISYLGGIGISSKIVKGEKYNEMTYILYLAPAKMSGYETCPFRTQECTDACLNESGHNKMGKDYINNARISRTKLFFEQRNFFMSWLVDEIKAAQNKAFKKGYSFSVRLNGTSDLSMESFKLDGKNILEIFPNVMFYDYTKVPNRIKLLKYQNYDLTFSYSGENKKECLEMLSMGIKVAVVFGTELPKTFWGYTVIDGDKYDMRYKDKGGVIIGLKFKKVRKKIDGGNFIIWEV